MPFECYPHVTPGLSSLFAYPSVLCDEDEHDGMVIQAVLAIVLVPVNYMAYALFATYQYKARVVAHDLDFIERHRFLFSPQRFRSLFV